MGARKAEPVGCVLRKLSDQGILYCDRPTMGLLRLSELTHDSQQIGEVVELHREFVPIFPNARELDCDRFLKLDGTAVGLLRVLQPTPLLKQSAQIAVASREAEPVLGDSWELGREQFLKFNGALIGPLSLREPTCLAENDSEAVQIECEKFTVSMCVGECGHQSLANLHAAAIRECCLFVFA